MKAIFPSLASVDNSLSKPEAEAAGSEQNGAAQGFDALLALVAAQTPTATPPVKALAPSVGVQLGAFDGPFGARAAVGDKSVAGQKLPADLTIAVASSLPSQGLTVATTAVVGPAQVALASEPSPSKSAALDDMAVLVAPSSGQRAPSVGTPSLRADSLDQAPAVVALPETESQAAAQTYPTAAVGFQARTARASDAAVSVPPQQAKPAENEGVVRSAQAASEQPLAATPPSSAIAQAPQPVLNPVDAPEQLALLASPAVAVPNVAAQAAAPAPEPIVAPAQSMVTVPQPVAAAAAQPVVAVPEPVVTPARPVVAVAQPVVAAAQAPVATSQPVVAAGPQPVVAAAQPVVTAPMPVATAPEPMRAAPAPALAAGRPVGSAQAPAAAPEPGARLPQAVVAEQKPTPVAASSVAATPKMARAPGEQEPRPSEALLPAAEALPTSRARALTASVGAASARAGDVAPLDSPLPSDEELDARAQDRTQGELTPPVPTLLIPPVQAGPVHASEAQRAPELITAATPKVAIAGITPASAQVEPVHAAVDLETGARVTRIEYFALPPAPAGDGLSVSSEPLVNSQPVAVAAVVAPALHASAELGSAAQEANAPVTLQEGAGVRDDAPLTPLESSSDSGARSEDREPAPDSGAQAEQSGFGHQGHAAKGVAFEPTDAHGIRGLDAVIASLLRAGSDNQPNGAASERVQTSLPQVQVQTAKSLTTKGAEKVASNVEASRLDALRREKDSRALREVPSIEDHPAHLWLEPRQAELAAPLQTAAEPQPLIPQPVMPDPDAAAMGTLTRGEGVNGAAISIEHPDLGSIDVVVQNENGRVDVRAVLDTPRAAAVLRAHESALRYGVQQAGMTFGALRVRSRNGETEQVKSRDSVKRRRGQEWEA